MALILPEFKIVERKNLENDLELLIFVAERGRKRFYLVLGKKDVTGGTFFAGRFKDDLDRSTVDQAFGYIDSGKRFFELSAIAYKAAENAADSF